MDTFLAKVIANGAVNGTWQLEAIDSNTSPPTTPSFVDFWSLNLNTGQTPDLDLAVPGTLGLIVGGSLSTIFPTKSAASPVGISPGIVLTADNTLGTFSPNQGPDLRGLCRPFQRHGRRHPKPAGQHRYLPDAL